MRLIRHLELSNDQATIVLDNIPQTYNDLYLVFSGRTSISDNIGYGEMSVNGSTTNWAERVLQGNSSATTSTADATTIAAFVSGGNTTANTFGIFSAYFPNYTSSSAKSVSANLVTENAATGAFSGMQRVVAAIWNDASPITSIEFDADSATNYKQYSSVTLYGILSGNDDSVVIS